jgi:hypothetical protein
MKDLYREAVVEGVKQWRFQTGQQAVPPGVVSEVQGPDGLGYWIARHAARETATALLKSAQLLGLSEDQYEELRKVAAEVAYD